MKAIFSTAYLPPIPFFQHITKYDTIELEKYETFAKQTFRNRCMIYSANGPLALTIPVIKPNGSKTLVKDIRIDNSVKWRREHWRAIESAYQSSAYFEYVRDYFQPYFTKEWGLLWDFNLNILSTIVELLELDIFIEASEAYQHTPSCDDYRNAFNPKTFNTPNPAAHNTEYFQVFSIKHGFTPNLSILDLICNCGMDSKQYILGVQ